MSNDIASGPGQPLTSDDAPLAAALLSAARRDIASFHALPASHGASLRGSAYEEAYHALYGQAQLDADVSFSGVMLDSFFRPQGPLRAAQRLAARAFGADATYFLSTGTSTANRVALSALTRSGGRVLADRSCHQSVHFALGSLDSRVDYAPMRRCCAECPRTFADLPELIHAYRRAVSEGRPYDTVVLSAVSYDGVRYDLPAVLDALHTANPVVTVLVDEAWGAAHGFHSHLRELTALHAFARLRKAHPDTPLTLAVSHSAHKSMSSLRQGSYLHLAGGTADTQVRIAQAVFQHHTTSPSFPVLASLDLARLQAEREGQQLLGRSLRLAQELGGRIATDPDLSAYRVLGAREHLTDPALLVHHDPTRVLVGIGGLDITAGELRRLLFEDHGIYAARESGNAILFHLHIGVDDTAVNRLLAALAQIQRAHGSRLPTREGQVSDHYIIAYPPGIPLAVPGEPISAHTAGELSALRSSGCEIYTLQRTRTDTDWAPTS
jgi:arginine/lysine/ornithine decarboxylase